MRATVVIPTVSNSKAYLNFTPGRGWVMVDFVLPPRWRWDEGQAPPHSISTFQEVGNYTHVFSHVFGWPDSSL